MKLDLQPVLTRLEEPATYAGLSVLAGGLGLLIPTGVLQDIIFVGTSAAAIAAVVLKEGWKKALDNGDLVKAITSAQTTAPAAPALSPALGTQP
jgi:hypothetical protein